MAENEIKIVVGRGIPKPADNQNTDDILPSRFMKQPSFKKMGEYVYFNERFKDGKPVIEHPFNDSKYAGTSILIAGANYGTGSSREHAPQGLYRFGIRGIIAESYADIFDGNCATIGIAAVKVHPDDLATLIHDVEETPSTLLNIDLGSKRIVYIGSNSQRHIFLCDIPEGTRQALWNGSWDVLPILQGNEDKVREVEARLPYLRFR